MKSFNELQREIAIVYLLDWMKTAFDILWEGLNRAFHDPDQRLFTILQNEMNEVLLDQLTTDLEGQSTQTLCRMADDGITGSDLRLDFVAVYFDELSDKVEAIFTPKTKTKSKAA
jgi:hypothetical protein